MSQAVPETTEEYQARLDREWGTWVATSFITHDGVLVARPGDAIPVTNVELYKYDEQGLVAKTTTKAGKAVVSAPATEKGNV